MSFIRQSIIAPILFWIILAGGFSSGLGYLIYTQEYSIWIQLGASMGTFILITLLIIFFKLHLPLKKIIREMKALLTGKTYRRIMTSSRTEIGILAHFFNEVTRNLESISNDMRDHGRIKKELNSAQKIQADLLPKEAPTIQGLDIAAKSRPASEIGGDTFDFFVENNRTIMYIGDSTGHGIPAGIVMVMVDTLIETFIDLYDSISDIMISLNKYIKPHLQTTMFMTMNLLEWTPSTNVLKWVGAGHEQVIHLNMQTKEIQAIVAGGIAVGMIADNTALVKEQQLVLQENDFVVLFTDGITEVKNVAGQIYGLERLMAFIQTQASLETSSEDLFKKIAIDVGRFMEGAEQLDDMTLIVMKATTKQVQQTTATTKWSESNAKPESVAVPQVPSNEAPA